MAKHSHANDGTLANRLAPGGFCLQFKLKADVASGVANDG